MERFIMTTTNVPEVRFDAGLAQPIFPRPVLKNAVLVHIPRTETGSLIPTFIKAEWGDLQVFYGDYYAIIGDEDDRKVVIYGSAKEQWENMHTPVAPGFWVKTAVPTAYQATEPCRIVTLIPSADGNIREANFVLAPGDWVVRQPGGEVQHIKQAKFAGIYFSHEEANELGLTYLPHQQFAIWAVQQVRQSVSV
ncbi:MAG TPA: hypothetical protein VK978_01880 [Candidatus Saccharimonadales bacterium]|nr:hypothetical protein [Candidatus Saccharimonadales bacterium]